jgi:hypothetical protein
MNSPLHPLSDRSIRIHFKGAKNKKTALTYRLYDHRVADRWWALMHEPVPDSKIHEDGIFFGQLLDDAQFLVRALNEAIETVNQFLRKKTLTELLIPLVITEDTTQAILSELHVYFEKYCGDPRFTDEIRETLLLINIYIHRLESFVNGNSSTSAHIEVLPFPTRYLPFETPDYALFTPHWQWGGLYMTYGITGVPTVNGFRNDSAFRPQHCMSQGMLLGFFGDIEFTQFEDLHKWLRQRGLDPHDPQLAIGYMPLGFLEDPQIPAEDNPRTELLLHLGQHRKVSSFELLGPQPKTRVVATSMPPPDVIQMQESALPAAAWPYDPEIFYHLDLVPYIDLGFQFNPAPMLKEAERALGYFVTHRDYDQTSQTTHGKWKALGLRALFGDWEKTQYHTFYSFSGEAVYKNTVFAEFCPETMRFLRTVTDLEQCERVRFMLLEPGACIKVHSDSQNDVSFAVNISLNMPEGCEFWSDLNADGSKNTYSRQIPFKDSGSVILFNNAKFHKVENHSSVSRMHLILHGPVRLEDAKILERARQQNHLKTRKELLKQLIRKKAFQGESFEKTPMLLKDWMSSGLDADMFGDEIRLVVWAHEGSAEVPVLQAALEKITMASLFPLKYVLIPENTLDASLKQLAEDGAKFAVVIAAGTLVAHMNPFILSVIQQIREMTAQSAMISGHIVDFPAADKVPYLHEQFLILDLKRWSSLHQPALGPLYSDRTESFPAYDRGADIHDDYTPRFLAPGNAVGARTGLSYWGTHAMAESLAKGWPVLNLSHDLRSTKLYSYPRDNNPDGAAAVQKCIESKLQFAKNEVFFFNNEDLAVAAVENFAPTQIVSVAAGFKALKIMDQYNFSDQGRLHYVDFSENALTCIKGVIQQTNITALETEIDLRMRQLGSHKWEKDVVKHLLNHTVREYFGNDVGRFEKRLKQARNAHLSHLDFVQNPEGLAKLIDPRGSFIIWISNAFYNNHIYFLLGVEEAAERYRLLARTIASHTRLSAFHEKGTATVLFGESPFKPVGMLTDGGAKHVSKNADDWELWSHDS